MTRTPTATIALVGCALACPGPLDFDTAGATTESSSSVDTSDTMGGVTTDVDTEESTTEGGEATSTSTDPSETATTGTPEAVCGDGVIEGEEACDDGNADPDDGCLADCTRPQSLLWEHFYESTGQTTVMDIGVDGYGNVVAFGHELPGDGSPRRVLLQKLSPEGDVLWTRVDEGGTGLGGAIEVLPDGRIYCMDSRDLGVNEIVQGLWLYDPDGTVLSHKLLEDQTLQAVALVVDFGEVGDLFATGYEILGPLDPDIPYGDAWVARFTATGALQWKSTRSSQIGGPLHPLDMALTDTGNILVVGRDSQPPVNYGYPWMASFEAATGVLVWEDFAEPEGDGREYGGLANLGDDWIAAGDGQKSTILWRYTGAGESVWERSFAKRWAHAVLVAGDERVFVVGFGWTGSPSFAFAQRWTADGSLVWSETYSGGFDDDSALAVADGGDGTLVIAGRRGISQKISYGWVAKVAQ